jgi:hypothetical protein
MRWGVAKGIDPAPMGANGIRNDAITVAAADGKLRIAEGSAEQYFDELNSKPSIARCSTASTPTTHDVDRQHLLVSRRGARSPWCLASIASCFCLLLGRTAGPFTAAGLAGCWRCGERRSSGRSGP